MTYSTQSLADPAGSSALVAAAQWLQGTLLGTVATTIAVVAIATMGFMMLTGRTDWKRGVTVIVGCFIVFGASSIAAGIQSVTDSNGTTEPPMAYNPSLRTYPTPVQPSQLVPYDPYAGASVPPN